MYDKRLVELAHGNFVSEPVDAIRALRQKLHLNEERLVSYIRNNAKAFESAFKYQTDESFKNILRDIPNEILFNSDFNFIVEDRNHIKSLAETPVEKITIVKTKGGIIVELYGYMRFKVPFWLGLEPNDFQLIINHIEQIIEQQKASGLSNTIDELKEYQVGLQKDIDDAAEKLHDTVNDYANSAITIDVFQQQSKLLSEEIAQKEKALKNIQQQL